MQRAEGLTMEVSRVYSDTWEKAADGWKWKQAKFILENINNKKTSSTVTPKRRRLAEQALQPLYGCPPQTLSKRDWTTSKRSSPENGWRGRCRYR